MKAIIAMIYGDDMTTKSNAVRELIVSGNYKKALSIVKGFRIGIGKEDLSKMALAYECLVHMVFYEQLGINTTRAIAEGIQVLNNLYGHCKSD